MAFAGPRGLGASTLMSAADFALALVLFAESSVAALDSLVVGARPAIRP